MWQSDCTHNLAVMIAVGVRPAFAIASLTPILLSVVNVESAAAEPSRRDHPVSRSQTPPYRNPTAFLTFPIVSSATALARSAPLRNTSCT